MVPVDSGYPRPGRDAHVQGILERAADGIRTHDLLHGNLRQLRATSVRESADLQGIFGRHNRRSPPRCAWTCADMRPFGNSWPEVPETVKGGSRWRLRPEVLRSEVSRQVVLTPRPAGTRNRGDRAEPRRSGRCQRTRSTARGSNRVAGEAQRLLGYSGRSSVDALATSLSTGSVSTRRLRRRLRRLRFPPNSATGSPDETG